MKILIKSTINFANYYVHAYETWKLALSQFAQVKCYGDGYEGFLGWDVDDETVYNTLDFFPDIELWCGGPGNTKPQYIDDKCILNNPDKTVPKVVLLTDYWEIRRDTSVSRWRRREDELAEMGVVGYFSFYPQAEPWMRDVARSTMDHFITFPYIYDELFAQLRPEKRWDVCNQGVANKAYPFRMKVKKMLLKSNSILTFSVENLNRYQILDQKTDPLEDYFHGGSPAKNFAHLLNSCWITITDGYTKHVPNKWRYKLDGTDLFNARFPQTLASQSVLFCPKITSDHVNELVDGIHYVEVDKKDFIERIKYYLYNRDVLEEISRNANAWATDNCSSRVVGDRLNRALGNIIE